MRPYLFVFALVLAGLLHAQTRIVITNVTITEKESVLTAPGTTIQLADETGRKSTTIFDQNGILVDLMAKVKSNGSRRSSVKDSQVTLTFEIDMNTDRDHDNRRVEQIYYMDQSRTGTVTQKFTFKKGIDVRSITVKFDVEIQ